MSGAECVEESHPMGSAGETQHWMGCEMQNRSLKHENKVFRSQMMVLASTTIVEETLIRFTK